MPGAGSVNLQIMLLLVVSLLVPLAPAGLALINTGLGRSRSAAHAMLASLGMMAAAALAYSVCGFAFQGYGELPVHVMTIGGKAWNWLGGGKFFLRGLNWDDSMVMFAAWLGMLRASLAAVIPLGSSADRWKLTGSLVSAVIVGGITFPIFAHWTWAPGWLAQLGANYGLGQGFLDVGGAGAIQVVGGLTALSVSWIVGPRRGKYATGGMPAAIPGHNAVLVIFGALLALCGWLAVNVAGAILFTSAGAGRIPLIGINTLLCASAAALMAAAVTGMRFGKPDASLCANGWVGGLVASSAACAFESPAAAVVTGLVAGALVPLGVEWFELRMRVDDPGGAISVHCLCGLWGLLAAGVLSSRPGDAGQWMAQIVGMATLIGFVLPVTYALHWVLNRFYPQRVAADGEHQGMDLYELGAGAYPEFYINEEMQ